MHIAKTFFFINSNRIVKIIITINPQIFKISIICLNFFVLSKIQETIKQVIIPKPLAAADV